MKKRSPLPMMNGFRSKIAAALRSCLSERLVMLYSPLVWIESLGKGRLNHGPFAGLRYPNKAQGSELLPKYAGCYEIEIQGWITILMAAQHQRHIHVGAGEGYYACGFALRLPRCRFIAYEMNADARALLHETVAMNHLEDRITIKGECTVETLKTDLAVMERTLVFMDAEGAEAVLLDPVSIPRLVDADIMVELHEFMAPGIGLRLTRQFQESHELQEIVSKDRSLADLPVQVPWLVRHFRPGTLRHFLDEGRPGPMSWLWMRPRKPSESWTKD